MNKRIMHKFISFVLLLTMLCSVIGTASIWASTSSKTGKVSVTVQQLKRKELAYSSKKVAKVIKVKKAYEALHIFEGLGGVQCDYSKQIEKNGMCYGKVTNKKVNTMKKLKKYLKRYFSDSYIKKLMENNLFVSKKGSLYFLDVGRGSDITYQYTKYKITKKTAKYRKIKATSYYCDDFGNKETKVDIYKQKKIKGKWVFTAITLPY